ncbi:MAG: TraB/GumN family protein [Gemmatimonadaceae bacterium]
MTHARLFRVALAALLAVAGGTAAAPVVAAQTGALPQKHILFRAVGPKGATVYLLGSVHLLTPEAGKLPPEVDSAYAHAKTIVFETSLDTAMLSAQDLLARAQYANGATLRSSLSAATLARLDTVLPQYGVTVDQLNGFKPWFVSVMVSQLAMQRANFQAEYGVDMQINARARASGKKVVGLEPVAYQLALFDSMPAADQEEMLRETTSPDSAVAELTRIKDAWLTGDAAKLDSIVNRPTPGSARLVDELVTQRTRHWVPEIEALLGGTTDALVVVGAAHLVGAQGVIALLRARGYRVEQL